MELKLYPALYHIVSWLFLRLLAIIYFSAFASMAVQIEGLVGSIGILPIATRLAEIRVRRMRSVGRNPYSSAG